MRLESNPRTCSVGCQAGEFSGAGRQAERTARAPEARSGPRRDAAPSGRGPAAATPGATGGCWKALPGGQGAPSRSIPRKRAGRNPSAPPPSTRWNRNVRTERSISLFEKTSTSSARTAAGAFTRPSIVSPPVRMLQVTGKAGRGGTGPARRGSGGSTPFPPRRNPRTRRGRRCPARTASSPPAGAAARRRPSSRTPRLSTEASGGAGAPGPGTGTLTSPAGRAGKTGTVTDRSKLRAQCGGTVHAISRARGGFSLRRM